MSQQQTANTQHSGKLTENLKHTLASHKINQQLQLLPEHFNKTKQKQKQKRKERKKERKKKKKKGWVQVILRNLNPCT